MAHKNAGTLRRIDEAMLREDMEAFFAEFTPDVIAHVSGKNSLAGDYKGLDQFQSLFQQFMERAGEYTFENHAYLADDEHGIVLKRGTYAKGGERLSIDEVSISHFRDGKVSEVWFVNADQPAFDAFIG